ncbi:uncharacterized protein LOC131078078 [Cryptomeria japonica]|uniref:uncharacterized protein LOC131078078 n=1 Tax=Cryptomeria japonica TaxID=3369 RepID=UPI0027DA7FEC|nr:uncharacterized protein LOC131078078 [Cryptomeria japonica]
MVEIIFEDLLIFDVFLIDRQKFRTFVDSVSAQYHTNVPYHNFRHACDVLHCTYLLLTTVEAGKSLNNLEKLALALAALCHDVDHPGLTNAFLINCNDPLAIRYNDISVLENHHASTTVKTLLAHESVNILSNLSDSVQRQVRKLMVNVIISTDMSLHADVLKSVKERMNESRHFQFSPPYTPEKDGSRFDSSSTLDSSSTSDALLLMRMLIKCADISNIMKSFSLSKRWAELLLIEWFRQGDLEKKLGLLVSKNMDREDPSTLQNITVGFINYVGKELYETTSLLLPKMQDEVLPNLRANLHHWTCYNAKGYFEEEEVENITSTSSPRLGSKILRQSTLGSESSMSIEGSVSSSHLSTRSDHPISHLLEAPIKQRKSSTIKVKPETGLNDRDMEIDVGGPPTSGCMNRHSILQSLSEWKHSDMAACPKFWMIARTNPYAVNINHFLESGFWQCIIVPMSLFAMFADDIQNILLPKSVDSYIIYIYLLCLALFLLEFMLLSVVRDGYFCSLSFWLDLIGSLSLVPLSLGKSNLNLIMARSIKAAKTFTHAAKWIQNGSYMKSSQFSSFFKLVRCKGSISPSEEGEKMDCVNSYCFRGKPSEIWTRLSELTSEKLAFGMLMIVLMYIRFLPGRHDLGPEASLRILDHQPLHSMLFNISLNHLLKFYKDHNYELLYLGLKNGCLPLEPSLLKNRLSAKLDSCNGIDLVEEYNQIIPQHGTNAKVDAEKKYRDTELLRVTSDSRRTEAYFSVKHYNQLRHSKNLGLTVVILFTLSAWSFLLSWDSNKLLIQPIERMVSFVKELADDPVSFAGKVVPEHPGDGKVMETRFIEASLIKIASLTKVALGDAGMDILSVNLKGSEFNPMVPGKKVRACFGFCDIRNFTDATECLQEEVMMFVNKIADLIHNKVLLHHGFPNKNIGDAFLIVWKKTISDAASKHFVQNGTSFADRALRSFLDIIHAVETSQALREYAMHPSIQKRMPGNHKLYLISQHHK